jgi:SAM-dependent methyltransferase
VTHDDLAGNVNGRAPLPPLAIRAWLRFDVVQRKLDDLGPASVLEIGCGQGSAGARLADRFPSYLGVEPDDASFAVAEKRIAKRGGRVIHGTHDSVPSRTTFDLVCAFEVLEHIADDKAALADWVEFVEPGGHLMLSVPAFQARFGPMDRYAGHFRRYEPDDLTTQLNEAGLVDVDVTVYGWPLGYALELVRNRIDKRKLVAASGMTPAELTAASGRTFQPGTGRAAQLVAAATVPFRRLQRLQPRRGTGLVAVARRPR